eukprot:COSAG01_NODE_4631_length_4863_cov_3.415407_2_plen_90_part_00
MLHRRIRQLTGESGATDPHDATSVPNGMTLMCSIHEYRNYGGGRCGDANVLAIIADHKDWKPPNSFNGTMICEYSCNITRVFCLLKLSN